MFNLSSPQDQVSNVIVNNAFLIKLKRSNFDKSHNIITTKLSINSITPSLKGFLT